MPESLPNRLPSQPDTQTQLQTLLQSVLGGLDGRFLEQIPMIGPFLKGILGNFHDQIVGLLP